MSEASLSHRSVNAIQTVLLLLLMSILVYSVCGTCSNDSQNEIGKPVELHPLAAFNSSRDLSAAENWDQFQVCLCYHSTACNTAAGV